MKENKLNEAKTTKFENKQKTKVEKLTNKDKTKMTTVKIEGETNPKKTHQLSLKQINWCFGTLGFILPILGYIFYLIWQKKQPQKSKASGWGSLLGSAFYIVITIIIILIIGKIRYR